MALLLAWVLLLAFFFAKTEVHIEGENGWAAALPTWRIEKHWLLDIFWGGRPMTGYHAWVFSFIFFAFHLPILMNGEWSLRLEARTIACLQFFWMTEDFLWFVINPAFGLKKFRREHVPWHKKWFWFMPVDYWTFSLITIILIYYSFFGLPI